MRFVLGSTHSRRRAIAFAHVCAVLCGPIKPGSAEVVDFRMQIDPYNRVAAGNGPWLALRLRIRSPRSDLLTAVGAGLVEGVAAVGAGEGAAAGAAAERTQEPAVPRGGSGLSRCGAAAALSYVSLLRNSIGLVCRLIGSPFVRQAFAVFCPVAAAARAAAGAGDGAGAAVV